MLALYALLRLQAYLPLNPQGFPGVPPDLAFNIAISFVTNANWQAYGGETTLSHLSQMAGLTANNFLEFGGGDRDRSRADVRALARNESPTIGNFWVDMTRATLYILLPLSFVVALAFAALGVPQTLSASVEKRRRSKAQNRSFRSARSPARRRSSLSATTAAGSSTPIPPIPSKTRASGRICFRTGANSCCRSPWCSRSGAWSATGGKDASCSSR